MTAIRLIVGLGNPTREHERDRHNAGFWFVERLAAKLGVSLAKDAKYHGLAARTAVRGADLWLLMPQTYMNLSGKSVGALARFFKIAPGEILVAHDELDFAPGTVKLKLGGGVGGHNGLRDIAAQLGTPDFWRLRLGIGHPGDRSEVANWVLSSPSPADREAIEGNIERSVDVVELLATGDMQGAIQKLHADPAKQRRKNPPPGETASAGAATKPKE
jgi:PTH1 family peptidyl-tRNA hydrolase